jgi:hypothetical protein
MEENKNKKYRIGIVGSRNFNNDEIIFKYLDSKIDKIECLVSGGCPSGADSSAQRYARERGLSIIIHYPNWKGFGKSAGFSRNRKIVNDSEILCAWTTGSKGTQNSIDLAKKQGKKVIIFNVEPDREIENE